MRGRGGGRQIYMYMLTMEELSKTCGNMGTCGNFGREKGTSSGRPSPLLRNNP